MRADQYLTANGYYDSRARAQAAIKAGTVKKPSEKIKEGAIISAGREHVWVSRGGVKLDHALTIFGIDPAGRIALDVGASTGGFTHVASFISAMKVLGTPLGLAAKGADLITLVKPQFEVGKINIGRGGLVKTEELGLRALDSVKQWVREQGWHVVASDVSPIQGGSGNIEYLLHAKRESA